MYLRRLEQDILRPQGQAQAAAAHGHVLFLRWVDSVASGFSWNESRE